ncbi:ankyrin repeat-containing domain protein [Trichoderma chlorosporum]
MDHASLEILALIAEHLELADIRRWMLTSKRINLALEAKFYSKAVSLDSQRGQPHYLVRALLLNKATNAFRILLQKTSVEEINTANIDLSEIPGDYDWSLLKLEHLPLHNASKHLTSLLHIACQFCIREIAELIISKGVLPDTLDTYGWSSLHLASWSGNGDAMQMLIDHGADIGLKKIWHQPPLFDRLKTDYSGTTPVHQAAARGHLAAVELLLAAGADPKEPCWKGCDALGAAAKAGHTAIFQRLLEENYATPALTTALKFAAEGDSAPIVDSLLKSGAEPHDALMGAVRHNRLDNLKLLIEAKADLRREMSQRNVLQRVCSIEATRMILASAPGLSANVRPGMFHGTPLETLYESARYANPAELEGIAMLLIEDGCLIREPKPINEDNDRNSSNRNVLEDAAFWGHARVIETLLRRKRSLLHVRYRENDSPLLSAAYSASENKLACFKLLVQAGADIHEGNIMECLYSMSLQVAGTPRPLLQNALVTQYLIDMGLDINRRQGSDSPLIHALCMENDESAMLLIKAGADITARSLHRSSTLQEAASNGCLEAMNYLLENGNVEELLVSQSQEPLLHLVTREAHLKHGKVRGYVKMMGHLLLGHLDVSPEKVASDDVAGYEGSRLKDLAYIGRMEVIRQLCKKKIVDPGLKFNSRTAFDQLAYWHPDELADLMDEANQKWPRPQPRDFFGMRIHNV